MRDLFSNNNFNHRPEDGLRIVSRCPICQQEHNPTETAILDENDGAHLIYIKCRNCNSGVVAMVAMGVTGVTSLGLVTDLTSQEILKIKDFGRINEEDVLSLHKYLEKDGVSSL
jgi:hypothetical protein